MQFAASICFIILAIIDHFFFIFHPFEVAIIVDLEDKTEYDRAMLKKLAVESELNYEKGSSF